MIRHKLTVNAVWLLVLAILFAGAFGFSFGGCGKQEQIRVGFVAELSGRQAELGVQERNGAQFAVDAINASGGVNGRQIELIIRDDLGTPEGAGTADRELIDASVVAIIGHATSKQTVAALPVIDAARVVMMSPTSSAPQLSGASKYFFRVCITNLLRTQVFAHYIFQQRKMKRMAIIYDNDNAAYAKSYAEALSKKYQSLGGKPAAILGYSSSSNPDFSRLVRKLRASGADSLMIIASDYDTAHIAQRTRLMGWKVPLFISAWAQTEVLLNHGGKYIEGVELQHCYPKTLPPGYLDFQKRFKARFGRMPSFGAAYAFESVMVLKSALEKTGGKAEGLREALLGIKDFRGLFDSFSYNENGDVVRPFYIGAIRGGKFVTTKTYKPQD